MSDVTQILNAIEQGQPHAPEELLPVVYDELRKLAARKLADEKPGQTLQATALVHEAYLRLVGQSGPRSYADRSHFFAAAATAMRRILIDTARRKQSKKRGGGLRRQQVETLTSPKPDDKLLALDEALHRVEPIVFVVARRRPDYRNCDISKAQPTNKRKGHREYGDRDEKRAQSKLEV
jgi:RNA polymerase sigma factor (TIGR02999 family)